MAVHPDIAGFRAAQQRLKDYFASTVRFLLPSQDTVWPVDTGIDPETGLPYDPVIEPVSGGDPVVVEKMAEVAYSPRPFSDEAEVSMVGFEESATVMLILDFADYPDVKRATAFEVFGERYKITEFRADGLADRPDYYLVWGEGS